jgi:hypothetical protein
MVFILMKKKKKKLFELIKVETPFFICFDENDLKGGLKKGI